MAMNAQPSATSGRLDTLAPSRAEAEYYRLALLAPPAGLGLIGLAGGTWGGFMIMALFVAGIPYLLWASGMALWMRGRRLGAIRIAVWTAPFSFLVVFELVLLVFVLLTEVPGERLLAVLDGLVFFAPWVLGLGYAFVLLVLLGWTLFRRFRSPAELEVGE